MSEAISPNSLISHYRIVSKIGAGGMGEVYLAQDTRLDRKVALKILPAELASNQDRMRRFVQEAKAAAALNHPNIAHIYEIGEHDGTHYIAMEFIDGVTLRERIYRDGASLPKLLKYLTQVAEGLAKAHAAGIVHRDLKPDNIMITRDDYAKVLDFGLAKLVEPQKSFGSNQSGSSEIATAMMRQPRGQESIAGMVMGTVGYMSPEQASGRVHELDHRSDIFSFGCILFEAATGQKAFEGKDALDSLHKIVHAPTPQLKDVNPLAPADLQRVVRRCLAKEREKRYQSIKELAIELDDLQQELTSFTRSDYSGQSIQATSVSTSGITGGEEGFRIAVLPFKLRDADPDVAVLADGLSEEISTGLSRFRYLSVVTSTSSVRLKRENEQSLGAKPGMRYALEGSIRKGGSAIRVTAQLVDTQTGAQLWSETYNRDLQTSTIFAVQDDLAGRIVATVADSYGVLVHSMRAAMRKKDDADLTPAEWQFQYFAYREQITPSSHAELKNRLERVAKRNDQSDLWACLAQIYVDEYAFGFQDDVTSLNRALAAGRRAVELDRANQFALVALAQVHFFRQDLAAFGPAAERAMALNPLNTDAIGILGLQIVHTGEFERGTAIVRRAMELNPNHAGWMHFAPLWDHFHKGEYDQALECANRVDVPGLFWPFLVMASACGHLGRRAEAEAAVRDLLALDPEFAAHARSNVGTWHFASGLIDPILEGLRKAGLEIGDKQPASTSSTRSLASSETRADEGFWVAVLPFKALGSSVGLEALAGGLTEEIVTGLSRFSYLRVLAQGSTLKYANESGDVRVIAKQLGARYVMEGSVRQAGAMIRLAVQLVDAVTGAHLWADSYERQFQPDQIFAIQDEVVPRIVSTCADTFGVLARSISDAVRGKAPGQLTPYEALMRGFGYHYRLNPEEHREARKILEKAVEEAPSNADCWAMLSWLYSHEYGHGFNPQPGSLDRALAAARRAVDLAPSNHLAYQTLAVALFFRKDTAGCLSAAERAMALNPLDASNEAIFLITFTGDWERGCSLIRRAMELNPHHPGWYLVMLGLDEYRKANYREAVTQAVKANVPGIFWTNVLLAAAHGQLGEPEAARKALRDLLAQKEDFVESGRELIERWFDTELGQHLIEGLHKAGLDSTGNERLTGSSTAGSASGGIRSDEGFWVAVLPFKATGTTTEVNTLAEALSEEITTGLSRFSYLRVIARSSTLRYGSSTSDVRTVGKELGARYVIEGSLRQAGPKLRLAVQLVDATTGAHLWAENYERTFSPEAVFELQDDLAPRIVSTVADWYGVLPHSMSEALRTKPPEQLSPYEAVLRSFGYYERVNVEEHAAARTALERAVQQAPGNADGWAMLSFIYGEEHRFGFNVLPDPLGRALHAARRAADVAPSHHFSYLALAQALFFRKEFDAFRGAAERAIALNTMDGSALEYMGHLIAFAGDWERGCEVGERARQLNPNHPGWYWALPFYNAYRKGDYHEARTFALKFNNPTLFFDPVIHGALYGQLGEHEEAAQAVRDLLRLKPDFALTGRKELEKWYLPELVEHVMEGLRKAGLEIADQEGVSAHSPATETGARVSTVEPRNSIAVLPFANLSADPENDYFCDGLAEELLNALAKIDELKVAARTSAFSFKGKNANVSEIASVLKVNTVLEGSVRKSGNRMRVNTQLVNAADGYHLWSERYDREMKDIFDVQDEITLAVVEALKVKLFGEEQAAILKRHTRNAEAHEFYLRGLSYFGRFTPDGFRKAIESYSRAIAIDPGYASAYAGLAIAYTEMSFFSFAPGDWMSKAKEAARKALELDDALGEAHNSLAIIKMYYDWDYTGAEHEFKRAIALNPSSALSHMWYGWYLGLMLRFDESFKELQRAQDLDPLADQINSGVGIILYWSGQPKRAIEQFRKVLELNPDYPIALSFLAETYEQKGDLVSAIATIEKLQQGANDPLTLATVGYVYAKSGDHKKALEILNDLETRSNQEYIPALNFAQIYAGLGDTEQALAWLDKACNERSVWLTFLKVDPKFDLLRSDPRFKELLKRMNLPE